MKRILQQPIAVKLLVLLALPVFFLTGLGVRDFLEKQAVIAESRDTRELSLLGIKLGSLAHELQKERGRSATFLASKGTKFVNELSAQQTATDGAERALQNFLNHEARVQSSGDFQKTLAEAQSALGLLQARRQDIQALRITAGDSFNYFTGTIASIINMVKGGGNGAGTSSGNGRIATGNVAASSAPRSQKRGPSCSITRGMAAAPSPTQPSALPASAGARRAIGVAASGVS